LITIGHVLKSTELLGLASSGRFFTVIEVAFPVLVIVLVIATDTPCELVVTVLTLCPFLVVAEVVENPMLLLVTCTPLPIVAIALETEVPFGNHICVGNPLSLTSALDVATVVVLTGNFLVPVYAHVVRETSVPPSPFAFTPLRVTTVVSLPAGSYVFFCFRFPDGYLSVTDVVCHCAE
jgi:hypothetical protein